MGYLVKPGTTAEDLAEQREFAAKLLSGASSTKPVSHWTQVLAQMAQGGLGGYEQYEAGQEGRRQSDEAAGLYDNALRSLAGEGAASAGGQAAGQAAAAPLPASPAMGAAAAAGRDVAPTMGMGGLLDLTRNEEGFAPQAKWDVRQYSGGYGSRAAPGETFTRDKAEQRLRQDAAPVVGWIEKNIPNATTDQKRALVSFGYNLGTDDLDKLKPDMVRGDWARVGQRMLSFNQAGGEVNAGLQGRRGREAALVTGGGGQLSDRRADRLTNTARQLLASPNPEAKKVGQAILMKLIDREAKVDGPVERGTTPHAMTDENGNIVYGTVGKDGSWKPLQGAQGYRATPKTGVSDTGTELVTHDVYGNEIKRTPKDLAGKRRQEEIGEAGGQAQMDLPRVEANAKIITQQIDELANDPYLPYMTGPINSRMPNVSGSAGRVQSRVNQVQGQAFLQAFNAIKGAGQISEAEGTKATAALSRLQSMDVNDPDYKTALTDFRSLVSDLLEVARTRARGGTTGGSLDTPRPVKTLKFNAATGELE